MLTASCIITLERDKNNPSTSMVQAIFSSHALCSNYKLITDYLLWKKFSKSITQSAAKGTVLTVKGLLVSDNLFFNFGYIVPSSSPFSSVSVTQSNKCFYSARKQYYSLTVHLCEFLLVIEKRI